LVFHRENSSKNRIFSARKGYIRIKHGDVLESIPNARGGVPSGKKSGTLLCFSVLGLGFICVGCNRTYHFLREKGSREKGSREKGSRSQ
jgi:hypothetical protein